MSLEVVTPAPSTDAAWRDRLLASLRDCGVQRTTGSGWGRWFFLMSFVVVISLITIAGRMFLNALDLQTEGDRIAGMVLSVLWLLFAVFVLVRVRNRFIRQAWRHVARTAEEELARPNSRRPILYLRSFRLDERIGRTSWFEFLFGSFPLANAEQQLTKALRKRGPVVAIGRPNEKLPPLGAARFYVSDELWQKKVADVADESQLVLLATGSTAGLRWEVGHLIASVPPERLVLWLHPQLLRIGPKAREREWQLFLEHMGNLFPRPLPSELGDAHFIYFERDWDPIAVAPPRQLLPSGDRSASAMPVVLKAKDGLVDAESVAYAGPHADETFAGVVGARPLNGLRVAGFFLAAVALRTGAFIEGNTIGALLYAVTLTAAVFVVYRFLRGFWANVLVSLACTAAWLAAAAISGDRVVSELADGNPAAAARWLYFGFVPTFVMLTALGWTTRRIWPRYFAFWLGAFAYFLPGPLLNHFVGQSEYGLASVFWWPYLLSQILFAGLLTLCVWVTGASRPARESKKEIAAAT